MVLNVPDATAKEVEAQTVGFRFDYIQQSGAQYRPLRRIDRTLEDRELHTSAVVLAGARDPTQAAAPLARHCTHVVGNENKHRRSPCHKRRIAVEIAAQIGRQQAGLLMPE